MDTVDTRATQLFLLALGVLLLASVIASRFSSRSGVPVIVLFLGLGMLAGSEGLGRVAFENYTLTFRIGTVALVLILFDAGLNTSLALVRRGLAPALLLATFGVAVTAIIVGVGAHLAGFTWSEGLLLGGIASSTDAAAVFSLLRGGGVELKERVGSVIELESGLNDPMAVLLTVTLTRAISGHHSVGALVPLFVFLQLAVGAVVGALIGYGARRLLHALRLPAGALYAVLSVAVAFVTYGVASLALGSGFLAVYVAGVVLGNGRLPYRSPLLRIHDFVAWGSQIGMFVALGLLVHPSRLVAVAPTGLGLALLLVLVARPVAVALCLLPFRFGAREITLVGWVGLRGAVPIVLALIPILAGIDPTHRIFNVTFFVVLVSTVLQGGTTRWLTKKLGLARPGPPPPEAILEIATRQPVDSDLMSFYVGRASAVCGARIEDIPFPEHAAAMLIVRGDGLIAPKGGTELEHGDRIYVFCRDEDAALIRLLFGREDES